MTTRAGTGTRLGKAIVPEAALNDNVVMSFRAVSSHAALSDNLGALRDLPGLWEGTGFSLIARSDCDAVSLESVFAIERVQGQQDTEYLQLQYSQTALLQFRGLNWPHVTVGTLIKAF
jgi:hypothetical protein